LVGLIIGLIIGLPILGWYVFPVEWYDTDPFDLRQEHKEAYISMLADSYALNPNVALARQRVKGWDPKELGRIIGQIQAKTTDGAQIKRLSNLAAALGVQMEPVTPEPTPQPTTMRSLAQRLLPIIGIPLAVVLVIAGVIVGLSALRERRPTVEARAKPSRRPLMGRAVRPEDIGKPLGRFVASYTLGQDSYDQSFPIESPTGEFLGECGMGISEVINTGPPANVTAFEVWLFDKDDIRTVTKVLMSNYAYNDDALRAKLAPKGEAVLVEPGKAIVLETASLRVDAEISEIEYGNEAAPTQSYFTRLTVSLTPSVRALSEETTF
jgi:hypothetical protein